MAGEQSAGGQGDLARLERFKSSWWRELLVKLAFKITPRLYPRYRRSGCVQISPNVMVKVGPFVDLTEAATLRFVAKHTSIPVPKVLHAFVSGGCTWIVMNKLKGDLITTVLTSDDATEREAVLSQLRQYMDELRGLTPRADTGVESCVGGSLYDSRISRPEVRFGPFKTMQQFHAWLRQDLQAGNLKESEHKADLVMMITRQDRVTGPPVFTHGDLHPGNILVENGRITGIVDWEFAGWYPSYWEYTATYYSNQRRTPWQREIEKFLDPHPEEMEMEFVRQRWFGEI